MQASGMYVADAEKRQDDAQQAAKQNNMNEWCFFHVIYVPGSGFKGLIKDEGPGSTLKGINFDSDVE